MKEKVSAPSCERANDLIAFLYGEGDGAEALSFKQHIWKCVECKSALAAFTRIRESLGLWRQECLGVVSSSETVTTTAAPQALRSLEPRKPSALAAVREFFTLAPFWLKGAVVFVSALFCLFGVLAITRFRDTPAPPAAVAPGINVYTDQDLQAIIEKRAEERAEELKASQNKNTSGVLDTAAGKEPKRKTVRGLAVGATDFVYHSTPKTRRPLTKSEREQLAADLRLISPKDEANLDLLGDRFNRQD
jgi:anti-sigma factor RsiW